MSKALNPVTLVVMKPIVAAASTMVGIYPMEITHDMTPFWPLGDSERPTQSGTPGQFIVDGKPAERLSPMVVPARHNLQTSCFHFFRNKKGCEKVFCHGRSRKPGWQLFVFVISTMFVSPCCVSTGGRGRARYISVCHQTATTTFGSHSAG